MTNSQEIKRLSVLESNEETSVEEIENEWINLINKNTDSDWDIYIAYNKFRLRNLNFCKISRPAIIVGAVNDAHFPNFHTVELLKIADVVSLTTQLENANNIDRIYYSLVSDSISDIVAKLPSGFNTNFYWDSQAEHGHPQPMGLATAPFLTVASICHIFHSPAIKRLLQVFDFVLPVGRVFDEFLSNGKSKVLRFPFGLNWASMHQFSSIKKIEKDIDVSVTFSPSESPAYQGKRNEVLKEIEVFQQKYSDKYKIKIEANLNNSQYTELLNRSKISLNVVGFNGPYNYRTCEILNSECLLLQTNVSSHQISPDPEDIFIEGEHFISFEIDNLEQNLLDLLEDQKKVSDISKNGKQQLEKEYSYYNIFTNLINRLQNEENRRTLKFDENEKNIENFMGDFNLAAFLWEQPQKSDLRNIGAGLLAKSLFQFDDTRFFSNLLAILPELLSEYGFEFCQSVVAKRNKELALSMNKDDLKQNVIQIYSSHSDHVAVVYNMISIMIENEWIDREQLSPLVNQAFSGKEWDGYDYSWLLRYPILNNNLNAPEIYDKFSIPLLKAVKKIDEWRVYRDYMLSISNN